jgi:hypothetical protein
MRRAPQVGAFAALHDAADAGRIDAWNPFDGLGNAEELEALDGCISDLFVFGMSGHEGCDRPLIHAPTMASERAHCNIQGRNRQIFGTKQDLQQG